MGSPDYPRIIAHRCGGALAPENTLAGLRAAAGLGIKGVEFDVMLARDGVPVLMHDETLERTTDGRGRVVDHDLASLKSFDAGVSRAPTTGLRQQASSMGEAKLAGRPTGGTFAGERIPTLAEAWRLCAELGLWANVEIKPGKGGEAEAGGAVGTFLRGCWRKDAGVVSSFSEEALLAFARQAPAIPRALLVREIPADWRARLDRTGCTALHCAAGEAIPARLAEVLAAGVPVACYTVNSLEAGERLLAAGVAAIFTDRPESW